MIYDCFTYFNEIEILELRLHTLAPVVDYFVIVEADQTFGGKKRDFHFAAHRDLFAEFDAKIIYVQVKDMPETDDEWVRQHFQRNCISRGLTGCKPDDLVLVSDVDEIPHPDAVRNLLSSSEGPKVLQRYPVAFAQRTFYYYVNSVFNRCANGTVAIRYRNLTQPEQMRTIRDRAPRIREGGWHFTYLGGVDKILEKIDFLGHGEKNVCKTLTPEFIQSCLNSGSSAIHNAEGHQYRLVHLDDSFPAYLPRLIEKYPYLYHDSENFADPATAYPPQPGHLFTNFPRWYWYLLRCRLAGREPF